MSDGEFTTDQVVSNKVGIILITTYRIASSGLVNMGSDCGGGHRYGGSGNIGVSWTDAGVVRPRRITIDYKMGVNCGGASSRTAFINGTAVGTAPTGTTTECTCSPRTYLQRVTYDVPTSYVPGGKNEFTMTRISSDGWSSDTSFRDGSTETWAVVNVEY